MRKKKKYQKQYTYWKTSAEILLKATKIKILVWKTCRIMKILLISKSKLGNLESLYSFEKAFKFLYKTIFIKSQNVKLYKNEAIKQTLSNN